MDLQTAFNIVVGLCGFLGGWLLKYLHDVVRDLQRTDMELANKVQHIEVLVAGEYVKHSYLDRHLERLFTKLEIIEAKLDGKADRG